MNVPEKLHDYSSGKAASVSASAPDHEHQLSSPIRVAVIFLVWAVVIDLILNVLVLPAHLLTWSSVVVHVALLVIALGPVYYLSLYVPLGFYVETNRHAQQSLEEALDRVHKIVNSAFDGIIVIDERGRIEEFNAAAERIFGHSAAEMRGKNIGVLMPEHDRMHHDRHVSHYVSTGSTKVVGANRELNAIRNGSEIFPIELHVAETSGRFGRRFVGTVRDITRRKNAEDALKLANEKLEERVAARTAELETVNAALNREIAERKRIEAQLQAIATTDALTGVLNRREFDRLLTAEYEKMKRYHTPGLSIIFFDIDRFKQVNDRFGHLVGDRILTEVANLVKTKLRRSDIFARWGGEEFVILAHGDLDKIHRLADKLRSILAQHSFPLLGHITCSFGVAEFSEKETMMETIERADRALYAAKANGRNRVEMAAVSPLTQASA
jgi:diguanylate cyclase (GGDEF)-like protein/PAS domain S-box-containing protein